MVLRGSEETRNDQLSDLQTGTRRPVLRQDLRPRQGLRMSVREVQAPETPRCDLRKVRRGSHVVQGAPRAHGAHRARQPGGAYLVPEVAALAPGLGAGHDLARHRASPLFRGLRRGQSGDDAAAPRPTPVRGRLSVEGRGVRGRLLRDDGRGGHPRVAAPSRPQPRDRSAAQGSRRDRFRNQDQEDRQASQGARGIPEVRHQAGLDDHGSAAGVAARAAPARAAGWRTVSPPRT